MAAGSLFFDAQGRVLLVKPTYKPTWEIPGGIVSSTSSRCSAAGGRCRKKSAWRAPSEACWWWITTSRRATKTESLMFIFSGGVLSAQDIASIRLRSEELSEYRFFDAGSLPPEMTPTLRARVLAAWRQAGGAGGVYLEDQGYPES